MEEGQVCSRNAVEIDDGVRPGKILLETGFFVGNNAVLHVFGSNAGIIDAPAEPSAEHSYSHDTEYQPENETHEQHVEDWRNRLDESIHNNLQKQPTCVSIIRKPVPCAT